MTFRWGRVRPITTLNFHLLVDHDVEGIGFVLRRSRAHLIKFLAAIALAMFAAPTPAHAHHTDNMYKTPNYGPNCGDFADFQGTFCRTDNATLTVFRENSLSPGGKATIGHVLSWEFEPTDLTVQYPANGTYSGDFETDIIYQRRLDVPAGNEGFAWCNDGVNSEICDQQYVAFLSDNPPAALVCHESGHAVGLTHGFEAAPRLSNEDVSLACLRRPVPLEISFLGAHNVHEINLAY